MDKLACGILYQNTNTPDYHTRNPFYKGDLTPFYKKTRDLDQVEALLK